MKAQSGRCMRKKIRLQVMLRKPLSANSAITHSAFAAVGAARHAVIPEMVISA